MPPMTTETCSPGSEVGCELVVVGWVGSVGWVDGRVDSWVDLVVWRVVVLVIGWVVMGVGELRNASKT